MTERLHFHFSLSCTGEGNGNPLQCSCLENPRDGGAWWAAVYGVEQSRTRLKRLSSSSSSSGLRSLKDFPGSSAGKESACNAEDPGLIPGLGRSPGEGKGYPLQYSWASLMAQKVKNPPIMWETCVWSLGWEDSLEEGIATRSSIIAWRISMDRGAWQATVNGVTKSWTQLSD